MRTLPVVLLLLMLFPGGAPAAVGVLLPSADIITPAENQVVTLRLRRYEPLQRRFEPAGKVQRLGVQHLGEEAPLLPVAKPTEDDRPGWQAAHPVKRPGDYTYFAELAPQWDGAEEQFTVLAAKLCVHALPLEEGWDEPVGLDAEIVPFTRPYGLGEGSLFSGQVLFSGEPVPYALVEILTLGTKPESPPAGTVPAAPYLVQKVRADADGLFHAALPRSGWWGFAATVDPESTLRHEGQDYPVMLSTAYWVRVGAP